MSLRNYQASNELERVSTLSAFNVNGAIARRKVNQFLTVYSFADGSKMKIYPHSSKGSAFHPSWRGTDKDVHLGPIANVPLRINR